MKATKNQIMTLQSVKAYMLSHNIPKPMIESIRTALIYDAVVEGNFLQYDRIYTGVALMLHREFGFGAERIARGLHSFDEICGSVLSEEEGGSNAEWPDLMQQLKDETGIVIHTGTDKRLICEHGPVE